MASKATGRQRSLSTQYAVDGLTFVRKSDHRVVVSFRGPRTQENLSLVAALYLKQARYTRTQFRGEWRWCAYPQCASAVYLPQKHLKRGACTCSQACAGKVHTLRALQAKQKQDTCCHRWSIEGQRGPISVGICWQCGAVKEFYNSLEYSIWDLGAS